MQCWGVVSVSWLGFVFVGAMRLCVGVVRQPGYLGLVNTIYTCRKGACPLLQPGQVCSRGQSGLLQASLWWKLLQYSIPLGSGSHWLRGVHVAGLGWGGGPVHFWMESLPLAFGFPPCPLLSGLTGPYEGFPFPLGWSRYGAMRLLRLWLLFGGLLYGAILLPLLSFAWGWLVVARLM